MHIEEIRIAIREIQPSSSASNGSQIRYICMNCEAVLSHRQLSHGYAYCESCLRQLFTYKPRQDFLIVSVEGRSTLDQYLELLRWKMIEREIHGKSHDSFHARY